MRKLAAANLEKRSSDRNLCQIMGKLKEVNKEIYLGRRLLFPIHHHGASGARRREHGMTSAIFGANRCSRRMAGP